MPMFNPIVLAGAFLGWGLGANDSANIFGTAVYTKVVKYSTAVIITAIFVILGAVMDGDNGIRHIGEYAYEGGIITSKSAFLVMLAAALTVTAMTVLKLPVSTSQAVIGAIIGGGVLSGQANFGATLKFFGAWFLTPIGGLVIAWIIYSLLQKTIQKRLTEFRFYEAFVKVGYLIAGAFGAYSLGANNVANVTGIFTGQLNVLSVKQAVLIGGISIAIGVITYSKPVMSTVGERLVPMTSIAGFIVVISASITVYIYARIGIPVSTSQAVIGAIVGIGLNAGVDTINFRMLRNVLLGWFATPTMAGVISMLLSLMV